MHYHNNYVGIGRIKRGCSSSWPPSDDRRVWHFSAETIYTACTCPWDGDHLWHLWSFANRHCIRREIARYSKCLCQVVSNWKQVQKSLLWGKRNGVVRIHYVNLIHMQERELYQLPSYWRSTIGEKPVYTVPLILYCDDMSGNKSKKWHEFNNWCLMLAGLPRHLNTQLQNIHLITFSDSVSSLEMAKPIAQELTKLENEGMEVFDAVLNRRVHIICPLLCVVNVVNPRASELLNYRGSTARHFCRMYTG